MHDELTGIPELGTYFLALLLPKVALTIHGIHFVWGTVHDRPIHQQDG